MAPKVVKISMYKKTFENEKNDVRISCHFIKKTLEQHASVVGCIGLERYRARHA
jgi:hypothetical protein